MKKLTIRGIICMVLAAIMLIAVPLTAMAETGGTSTEQPTTEWEKTNPYKSPLGKFFAMPGQMIVKSILLPQILGGLGDSLKDVTDGIFTSDTVNMIMLAQREIVFDITQGSTVSKQFLRPYHVEQAINAHPDTKEKYASVAAALKTVQIGGGTGATVDRTAQEWAGVDELIAAGALDWGVTDRESFIEAAGIALRPLLRLLTNRTLNFRGEDGVYATAIIPGLKALGCKSIMSVEAFEAAYAAALRAVGSAAEGTMMGDINSISAKMKADFAIAAILNPILDLLEEMQADAQGTIIRMLPNLAYHKDDLTAFINAGVINGGEETKIFEGLGGAFGIDLSGSVEDVLEGALAGLPIALPPIPWKALAGAGDLDRKIDTVIAEESIVYAVLTDYVSEAVDSDQRGVQKMIADSLGIPSFLAPVTYYLLKAALFLLKPL